MTGRKIRESERWRGRRKPPEPSLKPLAVALAPSPPSIPAPEPLTAADRARIARWVASRIVSWPPDNCFHCKRPIVYGAKWVELVNENERARFHFDCAPLWRADQERLARKAMGLGQRETAP
jgi:hypothetical protein